MAANHVGVCCTIRTASGLSGDAVLPHLCSRQPGVTTDELKSFRKLYFAGIHCYCVRGQWRRGRVRSVI
ncbi:hypothetical protein DPMN_173237 [Dreissena polymorpha]|uniref:Uncharacterized protein n=1 Tax=Dreissena polymorpha TaxID=45954 RepID=A0A9D4E2H3_DREPO|nr:hypothetical protein DPMN_173237 [Dreissena polymorpha]